MSITIGGSQTGGTSTALTPAGVDQGGRVRYALPTHTALNQKMITTGVKVQAPTKTDLGFVEETVDISLSNAEPAEGCCTVATGGVYINLKIRRSLNQPASLVTEGIDILQGIAYAAALEDGLTKGVVTLS